MLPWIYILMSSGCTVFVAHLLKYNEFKKLNTLRVLTVNYAAAACFAFLISGIPPVQAAADLLPILLLAAVAGVFFIANFFIYSKSVDRNGVGISVAAMRISLIIPVLLSTLWYHEYLPVRQWAGVLFAFFTLILLVPDKKNLLKRYGHTSWLLILLFLFTGVGDSSLKIFEADFSGIVAKEQFLGFVFLTALLVGLMTTCTRHPVSEFSWQEVLLGITIGVPNFYSAFFLIEALTFLTGGVVYTAVNLFSVIGATILGIWYWGDSLNRNQWLGLAFTVLSVFLLVGARPA